MLKSLQLYPVSPTVEHLWHILVGFTIYKFNIHNYYNFIKIKFQSKHVNLCTVYPSSNNTGRSYVICECDSLFMFIVISLNKINIFRTFDITNYTFGLKIIYRSHWKQRSVSSYGRKRKLEDLNIGDVNIQ